MLILILIKSVSVQYSIGKFSNSLRIYIPFLIMTHMKLALDETQILSYFLTLGKQLQVLVNSSSVDRYS